MMTLQEIVESIGTLSIEDRDKLNLSWTGIDRGTLGDGSEVTFEVYAAKVI